MNCHGRTAEQGDVSNSSYGAELRRAMTWLGEKPDTIWLGQSCRDPGTAMYATLAEVPMDKRIELPVFENTQLGMSTGMALCGYVPISIYPRFNFLLEATSQLVSHLDKLPIFGNGYKPKVIIRTAIASRKPLDPQVQHYGSFTDPFRQMLKTVEVIELTGAHQVFDSYRKAYERDDGRSTLLVEHTARYA